MKIKNTTNLYVESYKLNLWNKVKYYKKYIYILLWLLFLITSDTTFITFAEGPNYDVSFAVAEEFKYGFDFNVVERGFFKGTKGWTPMDIAYIKMSCPIPGVKYVVPLYEWITFYGLFSYAVILLCELYFWDVHI